MRKIVILLSLLVVAALGVSSVVKAKAHVPLGRVQVCTAGGDVKNVAQRALRRNLENDGCRLSQCVFNEVEGNRLVRQFIFAPGDECDPTDNDDDGFCDATLSPDQIPNRLSAVNLTPACTDSF